MKRRLRSLGKIARVVALCGTVAWLALTTMSPHEPDAAHTERYVQRHDVRYVSADMGLALRILLGVNFALAMVAFGCHLAARDGRE
ncbi:hypothetical protein JQ543_19780 [Bradyrhizobium diazoefficiens]|nr:hypothetical protein [Bradyrhizobium diazoefficiens]MBR0850002.1 hypothetical protein [Bradyrhizobium diazoefficiens]